MSLFQYFAFGFNIESELRIPEFVPVNGKPDVFIYLGNVPDKLSNPIFSGVRFQVSPDQFLLKVDHIANYFAQNGRTITIQPLEGSAESDIRLFLLGSAFGALIHQRGLLPMHGSSICINAKAYIFSGISGTGKSTIAAGFYNRGYQILSDDISVVSIENKVPVVYAGYPSIKLWADSLEKLGLNSGQYARVRAKLNKHQMNVHNQFNSGAVSLGGVYILQTRNTEGFQLETLKGIEKFNVLKNNTYRLNFLKGLENTKAHFEHLSALALSCPIKRITRSSKNFMLDILLDSIEFDINL